MKTSLHASWANSNGKRTNKTLWASQIRGSHEEPNPDYTASSDRSKLFPDSTPNTEGLLFHRRKPRLSLSQLNFWAPSYPHPRRGKTDVAAACLYLDGRRRELACSSDVRAIQEKEGRKGSGEDGQTLRDSSYWQNNGKIRHHSIAVLLWHSFCILILKGVIWLITQ